MKICLFLELLRNSLRVERPQHWPCRPTSPRYPTTTSVLKADTAVCRSRNVYRRCAKLVAGRNAYGIGGQRRTGCTYSRRTSTVFVGVGRLHIVGANHAVLGVAGANRCYRSI